MKTYIHSGFRVTEFEPDKLRLLWWDKSKNAVPKNAFNLGFFGYFDTLKIPNYTLPVANLCVDARINGVDSGIGIQQTLDIRSWGGSVTADKVKVTVNNNVYSQFKKKYVATLIITPDKVHITDTDKLPDDVVYAVSGVPTIRNRDDVDYYNYVEKQGWNSSVMGATYRNWLGIRGGSLILICGRTRTRNYIYGMEFWKQFRSLGIDDLIGLDGGGSYINTVGTTSKTAGNRRINTIGVITR